MNLDQINAKKQAQFLLKSMLAGILIGMAGGIYLNCENKIVGAFLFSIGLIAVILLEANLFTGKIGYVKVKSIKNILQMFWMLIFNILMAFLLGLLFKGIMAVDGAYPETSIIYKAFGANGPFGEATIIGDTVIGGARLSKTWYQIFFDGFGCGVLIYLAVELFKKTRNLIPVILCVAAFILSGAEHSIADAFYLGASILTPKAIGYLGLVILGNAAGSIAIHWLQMGAEQIHEIPSNIQR